MREKRKTAIYLRISIEDSRSKITCRRQEESYSISYQRAYLLEFIKKDKRLAETEILEFCDDGYTGTSMERPGMQRLLKEMKENKIGCVIVKDLSRFSRNYIELGTYMNQIFPFMRVRFIAVNDHYDSLDHVGNTTPIDTAFQTLVYDLYSKDLSIKVKTSFENKCANGEYVFGKVPFGYEKSKEIKNTVVVNEKEAEIVRYIFALALEGNGSTQIARILNKKGIPTRMQMRSPEKAEKDNKVRTWDHVSIRSVLNNRFYLGEMAYGKSKRKYVGSKNGFAVPREEWKVIPDHHEPLVTVEDYEKVCLFHKGADTSRKREKNPLVGKLFCGGCGYSMSYKSRYSKKEKKYHIFECRKHGLLQIPECCTCFSADLLHETVLTMLNKELMVRGDAAMENQALVVFQKTCIARLKKKITESQDKKRQFQVEADTLYESYAFGEIQATSYRQKANSIKEQVYLLTAEEEKHGIELKQLQEDYSRTKEDMKQVIRYSHLEVLTQEVVDVFIKKIYVYKDKRVEIEWNFRENGKEIE